MPPTEATLEDVCQAMGLPGFTTEWRPGSPDQEMRVLLSPSFHPEVFLVFTDRDGSAIADVTCARKIVSRFEPAAATPIDNDAGSLGNTKLADLEAGFRNALLEPDQLTLGRDGIEINIFWRTKRRRLIVENANASENAALGAFVARLLSESYAAIKCDACKDGLAEAGVYVQLDLPRTRSSS